MSGADCGAALLAAAVRAAIIARAPRRTVAAVAGAVACAIGRPATAPAQQPVPTAPEEPSASVAAAPAGSSPEELLAALRAARAAQRRWKKTRRKATKEAGGRVAAQGVEPPSDTQDGPGVLMKKAAEGRKWRATKAGGITF